jgi:hypothetical protein
MAQDLERYAVSSTLSEFIIPTFPLTPVTRGRRLYVAGAFEPVVCDHFSFDYSMYIPLVNEYDISLDSEESLRRFQAGDLPANDQEWYRLVPPEAREALGKQEVQRQSVLFEVIKSEREYVFDLEAVQEVESRDSSDTHG